MSGASSSNAPDADWRGFEALIDSHWEAFLGTNQLDVDTERSLRQIYSPTQVTLTASPFYEVLSLDTTSTKVTSILMAPLDDQTISYRIMIHSNDPERTLNSPSGDDPQVFAAEEHSGDRLPNATSTALGARLDVLLHSLVHDLHVPRDMAEDWIDQCREASNVILTRTGATEVSRSILETEFDIQVLNPRFCEQEGQLCLTVTARAQGSSFSQFIGRSFSVAVLSRQSPRQGYSTE